MRKDGADKPARVKMEYEKPVLRVIELAAEEVLSIGCKTQTSGFNFGAPTCLANGCVENGS